MHLASFLGHLSSFSSIFRLSCPSFIFPRASFVFLEMSYAIGTSFLPRASFTTKNIFLEGNLEPAIGGKMLTFLDIQTQLWDIPQQFRRVCIYSTFYPSIFITIKTPQVGNSTGKPAGILGSTRGGCVPVPVGTGTGLPVGLTGNSDLNQPEKYKMRPCFW